MKKQSLYKVALAQMINATVGDIDGNTERVIKYTKKSKWKDVEK